MSTNQNTKTTAKTPISPVLRNITIPQALEALLTIDRRRGIIPTAAREDLIAALDTILAKAAFIGVHDVSELLAEQHVMLKALTGVESPREDHSAEVTDRLHTYRNLLLALAVAATGSFM